MIVTFRPTINTAAATDVTACYMNFLRCVTAIATANAGTTSITVNPFTASNTIDTTKNCIISIDSNTEAGGWIPSANHNVIASLSNTAATYTALPSAAVYLYKADFYNASGKATFPYKKLCFHSYGDYSSGSSYSFSAANWTRAQITDRGGHNMLMTFGCAASTGWTSGTFQPPNTTIINSANAGQTTSWTLNGGHAATGANHATTGLCYTDITVEYHMAITADYCIIWESKVGDTYLNGYFNTTTTGNGTTYWNAPRFGSMYYMGLRETQPWEDTLTNNPPWVCWQITQSTGATGTAALVHPHNQVAAFMITNNNNGVAGVTPLIYSTNNRWDAEYFYSRRNSVVSAYTSTPASQSNEGARLDGPIFQTRAMFDGSSSIAAAAVRGNSSNMLYMPQYDATTGLQVPGAYPIKISRSFTGEWNSGGACRGIYKSLSMPYATMKYYWQAATQTFTINGDPYLPIVLNEDMWLVRFA
jgi:hypothetical protein